ncbi:MAG TPA: Gfo/Idh/MocA family oxidoreductase [Candidatus Limiplasma sp.]|nr:Gfo/Idh/MocA family oxidoreductase [Candidatus Limiplasma sp.]HPS82470.1 Gfo/Idh/MocA family oxidoreductase [Candidatus Limiplasma sp.]
MLNVGIIGCGKIAQVRHLPEYATRADVKITALFDLNPERARTLAAQYGAKAYSTYEALLQAQDVDAVSVCTANDAHADITCAALAAGKHVLCEKPMATTLADCERMVVAARQSGKTLMIGQNQRLAGAHAKARELIRSGAIGTPLTFRTSFRHGGPETWSIDPGANTWFFDKKRAAMGAMADLGIHKTDLIQYLLGQTVVETRATLTTLDKRLADGSLIGVDDNAICIFTMSGGAIGTMTASWTDYGSEDNATVIFGTQGVLRIYEDRAHALVLEHRGGATETFDVDEIQTNEHQTRSGVIDLFVKAVTNPATEGITGESVLTAMRAVFGSIESSETGKAVRVNG